MQPARRHADEPMVIHHATGVVGHGHRLGLSDGRECRTLDQLRQSLAGMLQRAAALQMPD
jgi:hypothetical protein